MSLKTTLLLGSFIFVFSCGNNSKSTSAGSASPLITGAFTSECFKNKPATLATSMNIYTITTFHLNKNGSGTNAFQFYSDSNCANPMAGEGTSGSLPINYSYVKSYGDVFVMHVDQTASATEQDHYWITGVVQNGGYYVDIDYSKNPNCGPYVEVSGSDESPTEDNITLFADDPAGVGVRLSPI